MCNCFSQIPDFIFESLHRSQQIMCVTILLGLSSKDEAATVRTAACRALGIYVMFPVLRSDPTFVSDCALALSTASTDNNLAVRIKACWALGNLCDALVLVRMTPEAIEIPQEILFNVVEVALRASRDKDKVRSNAVRALGNFTRFAPPNVLKNSTALLSRIVDSLIFNLTSTHSSVKVRWNSAYAIANLFKNSYILLRYFSWTSKALAALAKVQLNEPNFKVRIYTTVALRIPSCLVDYANQFNVVQNSVIVALIQTLNQKQEREEEKKYLASLQKELIDTLHHLVNVSDSSTHQHDSM